MIGGRDMIDMNSIVCGGSDGVMYMIDMIDMNSIVCGGSDGVVGVVYDSPYPYVNIFIEACCLWP